MDKQRLFNQTKGHSPSHNAKSDEDLALAAFVRFLAHRCAEDDFKNLEALEQSSSSSPKENEDG